MNNEKVNVVVRCPFCYWRVFDKVTATTGVIEVKCPNCHKVVTVDLSLRRKAKYRMAMVSPQIVERTHNRIR